jgi:hypothetical protein
MSCCIPSYASFCRYFSVDRSGTTGVLVCNKSAIAALNSFSDFLIYLYPAKPLWGLYLPVKQRHGLIFLFSVGLLVCVAGVPRMYYLELFFSLPTILIVGHCSHLNLEIADEKNGERIRNMALHGPRDEHRHNLRLPFRRQTRPRDLFPRLLKFFLQNTKRSDPANLRPNNPQRVSCFPTTV